MPRSSNRRARIRWTMVAPTWLLMSSPMIGTLASVNFWAQTGSEAMNTGMQLMKATPASRQALAEWRWASSEPTGREDTSTSAPLLRRPAATSTGGARATPPAGAVACVGLVVDEGEGVGVGGGAAAGAGEGGERLGAAGELLRQLVAPALEDLQPGRRFEMAAEGELEGEGPVLVGARGGIGPEQ